MAAGDGVVEKIGTRAGYGRSITLKHLHGYETTYNHMSGYAKGLKAGDTRRAGPGDRLRRLDRPVDRPAPPLRGAGQRPLRRPAENPRAARARAAAAPELVAFEQERQRIDELLQREDGPVASVN